MNRESQSVKLSKDISMLKLRQSEEFVLLKAQLLTTSQELKPVNIIRSAIADLIHTPEHSDHVNNTIGFVPDSFVKKGTTGILFSQVLKSVAQILVSKFFPFKI